MVMDSREFELIALGHVISRYRLTGQLPSINGKPFSIADFKQHLFSGVDCDSDVNINVNNVDSDSNITIVSNVECQATHDDVVSDAVENKNLFKQKHHEQQ